jgi:hypothetical protein
MHRGTPAKQTGDIMTLSKNGNFLATALAVVLLLAALYVFIALLFIPSPNAPSQTPAITAPVPAAAPTQPIIRLEDVTGVRNKYDWGIVSGTIVNDGSAVHSVSGYVDFYDDNKVKFDHVLFFVNVDAHGRSTFECTSTDAEHYQTYKYRAYLDEVYT